MTNVQTINETPLKSGKLEINQAMYNWENINWRGLKWVFQRENHNKKQKILYKKMKTEITHCMFGLLFEWKSPANFWKWLSGYSCLQQSFSVHLV